MNSYQLLQEGSLALAEAEMNGIILDKEYLLQEKKKADAEIIDIRKNIFSKKIGREWKRIYGSSATIDSHVQLAHILYDVLKLVPVKMTNGGNPAVDRESLEKLNHPLCKVLTRYRKLFKLSNTFITSLLREANDDGMLRPNFDLHTTKSFRSSSSSPNFQNIPIHNPEMGKIVRSAFKTRKGRRLVELDYGGLEVRISACLHKDPTMLLYLNEGYDMHTAMAEEIFYLSHVPKDVRFAVKSGFVFPEFYGSYYVDIAPALWDMIDKLELKGEGEMPMKSWLKLNKIKDYSDFEKHILKIENNFWQKRFPIYKPWQDDWYSKYQKRGWFDCPTGFRFCGVYRKTQVINMPVQASAFHCLLWSFIHIQKEIKKRKMKTLLVGQIHDSIIADVPAEEFDSYIEMALEISTKRLVDAWKWIIVPLEVDVEVTSVDGNWFDKEKLV